VSRPDLLDFDPDRPDEVVARMAELADGNRGWVNLHPDVDEEPPDPGLFRIFSGRGPAVPECTWVPGERHRGVEHVSLGVRHASGPHAADALAGRGVPLPAGGVVLADHPRRGLVVAVPPDADHSASAAWLVAAARALTTVPLGRWWQAEVWQVR
jgi:hypothetical protein